MKSIRRFLTTALLTTIVAVNLFAAVYGYRNSIAEAELLFDQRLADIAGVLAETPSGYYRTATGDSAIAFQIWQGDVLEAASGNIPDQPLTTFTTGYTDVKVGGFFWRAYAQYLDDSDRWILVAESTDIRAAIADSIVLDSVIPVVLGLPVYGLLIWVVVGRGLRPLDAVAGEMRAKRSDDLSPVANVDPPQELEVLVNSINDLLRRLDASFDRERQFAADAAHELRTPLSVLKIQLHNLLRDATEKSTELQSLQATVERMERSLEQVLTLYRMSPDQFAANFAVLDLNAVAQEVIAELYPQIQARQQTIELTGAGAPVSGDKSAIRTLLINLVENASRYSGQEGNIRVRIDADRAATVLLVEDSGPGVPAEIRDRIFDRFYRGEHDYDSAGSGIGLAIVKNICAIHGADIRLDDSGFETGLAVRIAFRSQQS